MPAFEPWSEGGPERAHREAVRTDGRSPQGADECDATGLLQVQVVPAGEHTLSLCLGGLRRTDFDLWIDRWYPEESPGRYYIREAGGRHPRDWNQAGEQGQSIKLGV